MFGVNIENIQYQESNNSDFTNIKFKLIYFTINNTQNLAKTDMTKISQTTSLLW